VTRAVPIETAGLRRFKLPGSINWARVVASPISYSDINEWAVAREHIERAAELQITNRFVLADQRPCGVLSHEALVPAIAIPVEQKAYFECPARHLSELEKLLPDVDRLLLIGWRATEDHFLSLLTKHIRGPLRGLVVSGSDGEARNIARRLHDEVFSKIASQLETFASGFTELVVKAAAEPILRS